jgi:hydroxymethylpyrimidine/phosphomethylpyrimidine kinase
MSARIVILNVLDPIGKHGLTVDLQAASDAGATDITPIATGSQINGEVLPTDSKMLGATLATALSEPVAALLVGSLPNSKVAAVVAGALARDLPETMVFVPGAFVAARTWFAGSAEKQQRAHFQALTREATVAIMTARELAAWTGSEERGAEDAGEQLCEVGAYAAWVRDEKGSVRSLDRLVTGGHQAVLDYPALAEDAPDRIPGALTALLARGLPLQEAVAASQRYAACPPSAGAVACR